MPSPFPFTTSQPAANNDPGFDQPAMKLNNLSTSDLIAVDHEGFVNNVGGAHTRVQLHQIVNPGTPPVTYTTPRSFQTLYSYKSPTTNIGEVFFVRSAFPTVGIQLTGGPADGSAPVAASKGWSFLPGGMMIQWGEVSITGSSSHATASITFAKPFPTNCFVVVPGIKIASSANTQPRSVIAIRSASLSSFVYVLNTDDTINDFPGFYWTAIGN